MGITDNHTLFVKCDCATVEQIQIAFRDALAAYQRSIGRSIDCGYRVNLVTDANGNSFGIAFVFVTNPAVYHMLLRRNPDGSDRTEYIDDPSWAPAEEGELVNASGWSSIAPAVSTESKSWYLMCMEEEEEDRRREEYQKRHVCPKIAIQLDPLMSLPPIHLSPEQRQEKRAKIIRENEGKTGFNESLVEIPEYAHLSVDNATVKPVDPRYMPNILKAKDVPLWISWDYLKAQFAPYASDSRTRHERFIKGVKSEETYPFVNINDDRVAFIIFDPSTRDAQFALHMMKKTVVSATDSNGKKNSAVLMFGHSFRTDRDMMADISQRPRPARPDGSKSFRSDGPRGPPGIKGDRMGEVSRNSSRGQSYSRPPLASPSSFRDTSRGQRVPRPSRDSIQRAVVASKPQQRQPTKIQTANPFSILDDSE